MSDDLKARLRGAADYLEIRGITECNPKAVLWEADNALDAKDARIAELERQVAAWDGRQAGTVDVVRQLERRAEAAEAECERLREALQFYADEWFETADGAVGDGLPPLERSWLEPTNALWEDQGQSARTTLTTDHEDDNTTA